MCRKYESFFSKYNLKVLSSKKHYKVMNQHGEIIILSRGMIKHIMNNPSKFQKYIRKGLPANTQIYANDNTLPLDTAI